MVFLINAMWLKTRLNLSGIGPDLAYMPGGLSLGLA
jgi:hypothetical protein